MRLPAFVGLSVCLSVCLSVSKITQKRVHGFGWNVACRHMSGQDELINFWTRSGLQSGCWNRRAFSDIVCAATRNFITSGKSHIIMRIGEASRCSCVVLKWFYSPRAVGAPLSDVYALYRVPSSCCYCYFLLLSLWYCYCSSACSPLVCRFYTIVFRQD